jgi:hypothetical protein
LMADSRFGRPLETHVIEPRTKLPKQFSSRWAENYRVGTARTRGMTARAAATQAHLRGLS